MQALILAAGTGSRLGKYTQENTKCMLKVNGETLITQALNKLNNVGIKKLILVVGYKKDNLIAYVGNQYKNIEIEYVENPIYDKTNNIYSLYLAKDKLAEDDTILLESDLLFEESIIQQLMDDKRPSLAVVDRYKAWMDGTAVTLSEDDSILGFFGKKAFNFQDVESYYKTVNIYKFSKVFSNKVYIPFLEAYSKAMGDNEYYESVLRIITMLENQELKALCLNGEKWYEIDDVQDKANAEIIFASNSKVQYDLIKKRFGGHWRFPELKDFSHLVNPYFPTDKMKEELKAYFDELISQYPSAQEVQRLLAGKMFGVEADNIVVGNGSSEIIKQLGSALKGTFGVMIPTFPEYIESIGEKRIKKCIPQNEMFSYTVEDLLVLSEDVDNLLLINPDNPSGNFIAKNDLLNLISKLSKKGKNIIVDESFVDFSKDGEENTLITQDIIDLYPNLIIIRSISKTYGVPGIRLGILSTSNKILLDTISEKLSVWNINSFAEFFLQTIGKYKKDYLVSCSKIVNEKKILICKLSELDYLSVIPSEANYLLCKVCNGYTASGLAEILLAKYNILIKDMTKERGFENKEYIRISVENYYDNEFLISKLNELKESRYQ